MDTQDLLLLAGVTLLILTIVRYQITGRRKHRSGKRKEPEPLAPFSNPTVTKSKQEEELEVKLYDTFREMNAQLDTKIHILNELIMEADAAIEKLSSVNADAASELKAKVEKHAPSVTPLSEQPPEPKIEPLPPLPPAPEPAPQPSKISAEEPLVIDMDAVAPLPPVEPLPTGRPAKSSNSAFDEVYRLADEGHSSSEIASRMGRSIGEVDLILGLRRRRRQAGR